MPNMCNGIEISGSLLKATPHVRPHIPDEHDDARWELTYGYRNQCNHGITDETALYILVGAAAKCVREKYDTVCCTNKVIGGKLHWWIEKEHELVDGSLTTSPHKSWIMAFDSLCT